MKRNLFALLGVVVMMAVVFVSCQKDESLADPVIEQEQVMSLDTLPPLNMSESTLKAGSDCSCSFPYAGVSIGGNNTYSLSPGKYYKKIDDNNYLLNSTVCQVSKISGSGSVTARTVAEDIGFWNTTYQMIYCCRDAEYSVSMGPFTNLDSRWDNLYFEIIIENASAIVNINTYNY